MEESVILKKKPKNKYVNCRGFGICLVTIDKINGEIMNISGRIIGE